MFTVPERHRVGAHPSLRTTPRHGKNGYFNIPLSMRTVAKVVASDGEGWEHVSVHMVSDGKVRTPTWSEMCKVKDMFWDYEDCVVQYHPPKSEYVNNHPHTLHLWKPKDVDFPRPDPILVGLVRK